MADPEANPLVLAEADSRTWFATSWDEVRRMIEAGILDNFGDVGKRFKEHYRRVLEWEKSR